MDPNDIDLDHLQKVVLEKIELGGACAVGVCTPETLAGGPPSTDLERELPGAQAAIVFAMPQDEAAVEAYMNKTDHGSYQANYIQTNKLATGMAAELAHWLQGFGFDSKAVFAGNTKGGGVHMDPTPRGPRQLAAAERYPAKDVDEQMGTLPVLSQRYLAAAAGVGFFGRSGNILTASHGATIGLGATVTTAPLPPTMALPPEANYCDDCDWCGSVCPTAYMAKDSYTVVELGPRRHKYTERLNPGRCSMHMMGIAGASASGKFGSWGPAQTPLPLDDESLPEVAQKLVAAADRRPDIAGGTIFNMDGKKANIMCSACVTVCHPERDVRMRRMRAWRGAGITVQHDDGSLEAMAPEKAAAFIAAMPAEKRALYE